MKKWSGIVLLLIVVCGLLAWGVLAASAQEPLQGRPYFAVCQDRRDNSTEYERCVGNEINKQLADMNKNDQLNLDRCNEFLVPYDKAKYEACIGEEFNKFPEYGPEVKEQYLAGVPWSWPDKDPAWWDNYFPVVTPEAAQEGFSRWWEGNFYVTPAPTPHIDGEWTGQYRLWAGNGNGYGAPPQW